MISLIVAMDENRVIGKNNDIPWRLPKDLEYVKNTTKGHTIVLGRNNYESIGRPLPNRRNIVMAREEEDFTAVGCEVAHSMEEVFEMCKNDEEVFIFGGAQIYRMFLPYVEKMYITRIHHEFDGDTFFPEVDMSEWTEISKVKGVKDEKNPYDYYFHIYVKNKQ